MKTYCLEFQGYWSDDHKSGLPADSGVYVVSRGTLTPQNTVRIEDIVYIGEAEDVHSRHNDGEHEHYQDFIRECGGKEHVWYSCAKVLGGENERMRVENALIYKLQPIINDKGKDSFNYRKTIINSAGKKVGIPNSFSEGEDWQIDI